MFLAALYELSQTKKLVPDQGYVLAPCHYVMRISTQGALLSLSQEMQELKIPQAQKRTSGINPMYCVENVKYVFGVGGAAKETRAQEDKRLARVEECMAAYYAQINDVATRTKAAAAEAYTRFGQTRKQWIAKVLAMSPAKDREKHPDGWTGSEVVVCYLDDEAIPMYQRPALRQDWRYLRGESDTGRLGRCILTGQIAPVARLHPVIKGIPGAQASGASLCSYDKEAFSSQGAEQGENACISREGAEGYAAALNWLLVRTKDRAHQWGVRVGQEATLVVWTATGSQFAAELLEVLSPAPAKDPPSPEKALHYPAAAWSGITPELDEINADMFFGAIVSPNASRVVVRDFISEPVGAIKKRVLQYLQDLKIGYDHRPISLWALQFTLMRQTENKKGGGIILPSTQGSALMKAILRGTPYPYELLSLALARLRDPAVPEHVTRICCAVIKAVLLRLPNGQRKEVPVALHESDVRTPYLLGRLFAVMERLQEIAIPEIGASMRDKHVSTACVTPAWTYPNLLALSTHHVDKLERQCNGLGRWLENIKEQIMDAMEPNIPLRLMPEDQGVWWCGYYQQKATLWRKKAPPAAEAAPAETQTQAPS